MRKERDDVIENLSMLVGSGMDMLSALKALSGEARGRGARKALRRLWDAVDEGSSLSAALEKAHVAERHVVSLIRIGERSGRLAENLSVVALQNQKDRMFRSKLRSAMMYPVFVLTLAVVIGVGIAWFILPRLAGVFASLSVELPLITQLLITAGNFLHVYGSIVIPIVAVAAFALFYFVFLFGPTKFIGQAILFLFPGLKRLLQEIELARMGHLLGTLLEAGLPVVEAVRSLSEATTFVRYRGFYTRLAQLIEEGNSFEKSFALVRGARRLVPVPIQQMVVAGEQSGRLSQTFKSIGERYDARTDTTTKDLAVILEPILLVVVWLGVMFVALAVILPIYGLLGAIR